MKKAVLTKNFAAATFDTAATIWAQLSTNEKATLQGPPHCNSVRIVPEAQAIRITEDGSTTPTAGASGTGILIAVGTVYETTVPPSKINVISNVAGAKVTVVVYRS